MQFWISRLAGAGAAAAAMFVAPVAQAQDPVAIVEDVIGTQAKVQFMDYVTAGTVIDLGKTDSLVLGYMRSCWRETIKGGVVTVGVEQSVVAGGDIKRQKVECDGGRMRLTTAQAGQSGVMVFRGLPPATQPTLPAPQVTLFGLSPVVEMMGAGRLLIERLDKPGERQEIDIEASQLAGGAFFDFARNGRRLQAGGIYRATGPDGAVAVFRIDIKAKPGQTPIVGRLLKL